MPRKSITPPTIVPHIERGIGQSSYKNVTKSELLDLIDDSFPDSPHSTIAIITTVKSGDYDNPTINQSIVFSKILGGNAL